jgi:hypothetical protein
MENRIAVNQIQDFFGMFSVRTWLHLRLVKEGAFRLHETSITQNLVKDFWIESKMYDFPIRIYESTKERVNGNDLEILIETQAGYIMLPVQVKVLKQDERYTGISHVVRGIQQIDLLLDYATKKGGIPAYIFYNYTDDYDFHDYVATRFPTSNVCEFGCTIGNAEGIRKSFFERGGINQWSIPYFSDIHLPVRFAIPLHWAFCKLIDGKNEQVEWFLGKEFKSRFVRRYTGQELANDEFWKELFSPGKISGISDTPLMGDPMEDVLRERARAARIESEGNPHLFSPQFRVVISKRKETARISRLT